MAPRRSRRGDRRKERDLCASLKEIAAMLPVSGAMLTKKETLAHVLCYLDFLWSHIQKLQAHLPSHCLPKGHDRACGDSDSSESTLSETNTEPCTPPNSHQAQLKHTFGRLHKKPPFNIDVQDKQRRLHMLETDDSVSEDDDAPDIQSVNSGCSDWAERQSVYQERHPVQDSDSLPSSLDSGFSLSQLVTQTVSPRDQGPEKEADKHICDHRSTFEAHTGSKEGSLLNSPLSGTEAILLKDQMLGSTASGNKKHPPTVGSSFDWTSPLALFPFSDTQESLNLSPSLLNSPARGVISHLLPEGQDYLQVLFEDVWVSPKASPAKAPSSPECSLGDPVFQQRDGEELDSQREDEDSNWSPTQRGPLWGTRHSYRKRGSTNKRRPGPLSRLKKKCVNGFIMFCRVNRKVYLSCHPGTPSTVVTKELANLWHIMPKQERRVYSMKARHFSCQQNRNVKQKGEVEGEEDAVPSPLHTLLAHRDYSAARGMLQGHPHTLSCTENI